MNGDVFMRQKESLKEHQVIAPGLHGTHTGQIAGILSTQSDKPLLAGWSMGVSMILSELDYILPRVSGLIFMSGTPCFIAQDNFPQGMRRAIALKLYRDLKKDFFTAWESFIGLMTYAESIDENSLTELNRIFIKARNTINPETALRELDWLYKGDYRLKLQDIKVPLMIISGSQDRICLPDASRYMTEHVPGSSLHIIEGAGHMPFFTRAEEVNRLIRDFADGQ